MMSSTSPMLALRLIQRLKKKQASTPNAFTLVELLVVVAIVGILSAVALPNFLSQTNKAKATEAKTNIAATLKQAHAKFLEDGVTPFTVIGTMTTNYGTPANGTTLFNYATTIPTFTAATTEYFVTATANGNDSGLGTGANSMKIRGCVNFNTGFVDIGANLATTATAVDCTP